MFTGLIQTVGTVAETTAQPGGRRIRLAGDIVAEGPLQPGESIAVDGCCLTVAAIHGDGFSADVIEESLRLTTLGRLKAGHRVNLERALRAGDRLGGHIVQGHIDATGAVVHVVDDGSEYRIRVDLTPELSRFVAYKGSVALSGVSLTTASVEGTAFEVALIPTTLAETNLGDLKAGDRVNIEVDLFARYLERLVATQPTSQGTDA